MFAPSQIRSYPSFKPYSKVSCSAHTTICSLTFRFLVQSQSLELSSIFCRVTSAKKLLRSNVRRYSPLFLHSAHGPMVSFSPFWYEVLSLTSSRTLSVHGKDGKATKKTANTLWQSVTFLEQHQNSNVSVGISSNIIWSKYTNR